MVYGYGESFILEIRCTMVPNSLIPRHLLTHKFGSERVNEYAEKHVSKASRAESVNETAMGLNEGTDKQMASYLCRDSWLFCTIVW